MAREFDPFWGVPSPPEQRQAEGGSTSYTDLRVQAQLDVAVGAAADPQLLAAVETAASHWGRALQAAEVSPDNAVCRAVTAETLELVGRELVRRGEILFVIEVTDDGTVCLHPAAYWHVQGGHRPDSWRYLATLAAPSRDAPMRSYPADAVVHIRHGATAAQPWRGRSPLALSKRTADIASWLELRLGEEAGTRVGNLLPVPTLDGTEPLQADLGRLKGNTALVETTSGGWDTGEQNAPHHDFQPRRLGADPPQVLPTLRDGLTDSILAATGVPIELVHPSDGTGQRESWRRFLHGTILPVARAVTQELQAKLEQPELSLDFAELRASDVAGRARAFGSLVNGGMEIDKAAAVSGVLTDDSA